MKPEYSSIKWKMFFVLLLVYLLLNKNKLKVKILLSVLIP